MSDEDHLKDNAALARHMACFADPFTKKRLLDLAERYEAQTTGAEDNTRAHGNGTNPAKDQVEEI